MEVSDSGRKKNCSSLSDSFRFAFSGIAGLLKTERNAGIHLVILVLVIAAGALLKISPAHWTAIALAAGLVLAAESFNTAIEVLCDALRPEADPAIRRVKDLAAAGVLIAAISSAVVGLIVFIPAILRLF